MAKATQTSARVAARGAGSFVEGGAVRCAGQGALVEAAARAGGAEQIRAIAQRRKHIVK